MLRVIGSGPAGCASTLSALAEGAAVTLYEKSAFPRHKVCGEFLSPEIEIVLRRLNCWSVFEQAGPARIHRVRLVFGKSEKRWPLATPAFGLSRYRFDALLQSCAKGRGAALVHEAAKPDGGNVIVAHGRHGKAPKSDRLFGFKAHFTGPVNDAIELYFFDRCYAGVSAVEGGVTNICGLAPESLLRQYNFDPEPVLHRGPALAERMRPLNRSLDWLVTGPLLFTDSLPSAQPGVYECGDALGFVDPFTGTGMLAAVQTGSLAGMYAARGQSSSLHRAECWKSLGWQYRVAKVFRASLQSGFAEMASRVLPGRLLFDLTRPRV